MPNDPELAAKAVRALNEGRTVEERISELHGWTRCSFKELSEHMRSCDLDSDHVRIAPEPTFVPWTFETSPDTLQKARRKMDGKLFRVALYPDGVLVGFEKNNAWSNQQMSYEQFRDDFEQLNGSVCGKAAQS